MSLCSCVSNSHKFPAEFRWLSAPPVRICINFLSNFFVAAPVEKVEFLWWQDWLPIIRRRINFPIGARNQLNLLLLLDAPHYFSPYCSCQCVVSMLELWCVFWDKRHWLRPPSSPPNPPSTAGSRTIKITNSGQNLGLGHLYNAIIQLSNVKISEHYFGWSVVHLWNQKLSSIRYQRKILREVVFSESIQLIHWGW